MLETAESVVEKNSNNSSSGAVGKKTAAEIAFKKTQEKRVRESFC